MNSAGVIYAVSGVRYFKEVLISVRSLARAWPGPCIVYYDRVPEELARAGRIGPGVEFKRFTASSNPFADKVHCMTNSPFERTLFLDADTYVLDIPEDLFGLLDRFDLAAAHAPGYRSFKDPDVPSAFYEFNTGVILYRMSERMRAFFAHWVEVLDAWNKAPPFFFYGAAGGGEAEQPAFRRCLYQTDLQVCVLGPEYNYRLPFPGALIEPVHIIHGRHNDFEKVARLLNRTNGPRVFPREIKPDLAFRIGRKIRRLLGTAPA